MQAHQAHIVDIDQIPDIDQTTFLTKKQREQDWNRRKKKIEEEQSMALSTPWYVMAWSYSIGLLTSIQEGFRSVGLIKLFYPDNPGTREIFNNVGFTLLPAIIKFASPIALGMSWINAGRAIHRFAHAENKNVWEYANLFFSCAAPVIWTSLYIAGISLSVAALAPILPWVSVGIFGAYALHGLFNCITNCYRAFKAHREGDKAARNEYLKQAGKNLIGIVFNVLVLATSVVLGIKMSEATDKIGDAIEYFKKKWSLDKLNTVMGTISQLFDKGCQLVTALTGVAVAGVLANNAKRIANMNNETAHAIWSVVRHPIDTAKKCWNAITNKPVATLGKVFKEICKLPFRVVALAFTPIQLMFSGLKKVVNKTTKAVLKSDIIEAKEEKQVEQLPKVGEQVARICTPNDIKQRIESKIKKYEQDYDKIESAPEKIQAKHFLLSELLKRPCLQEDKESDSHFASIADIEKEAKQKSSAVYCSFFRQKGEVKEIVEDVQALEKQFK